MNIQDLEKLPSPPGVAVKLLELFSEDEVVLDDLNEVIGIDPTLTARIIKYANSPMFARRHEAGNLRQAIAMLGANGVKMIALSFSLTEIKGTSDGKKFEFNKFWNSSLATAVCNQSIYSDCGQDKDTGFLIGLLANIGQLAMFCCRPEDYEQIMEERTVFDLELIDIETLNFGTNRYALGAEVLESWNFPTPIVQALKLYSDETVESNFAKKSLGLANRMSYVFLSDQPDYEVVRSINSELASVSGNAIEDSELFFANTLTKYSDIASILSYDSPEQKSLKEIELEAKTRIVELSMNLHRTNEVMTAENDELKDMAYVDPLTKLGNRRQYESIAGAELSRCARLRNSFGLIAIDIDHFKKVNDTYGHAAGDFILQGVGKILDDSLRRYDFAFRYGGEEFVVILPESNKDTCQVVAERLRTGVESNVFEFEGQTIPITISLGGAIYVPGEPADLDSLFKMADEALYIAKESGRNQYQTAESKVSMPSIDTGTIPTESISNTTS